MKLNYFSLSTSPGFSLIELLFTMALFGTGLLSVIILQIAAYTQLGDSQLKQQAIFYASSFREINLIRINNEVDTKYLTTDWEHNISKMIPNIDIKIIEQLNSNGDIVNTKKTNGILLLSWPSSLANPQCDTSGKLAFDCLRF